MKTRLIALIMAAVFLSSCGAFKVVKNPEPAPTQMPGALRFEGGNEGDAPAGWRVISHSETGSESDPKHKLELTESQKRGGEMSLHLKPLGKAEEGVRSNAQFCAHSPFAGSAIRVSAYVRGDRGTGVFFFVGYSAEASNPTNNITVGADQWTKVDAVNSGGPRPSALGVLELCIMFGAAAGKNVWIDEITFTKVDLGALAPEKIQPVPLENMDMEQFDRQGRLAIWTRSDELSGEPAPGFEMRADKKTKRSGAASLLVMAPEPTERPHNASYCFDSEPYQGKILRVAGWLKADVAEQSRAVLGVSAYSLTLQEALALPANQQGGSGRSDSSDTHFLRPIDWTKVDQVLVVPKGTKNLCITISIGHGSLWADDFNVDVIQL
ncbi:MAG TPA: hypothetical protein VND22_05600 [Actinomycetota bacterium]|nr:hypothetical protein [Actinomycetota bacterium]